MLICNEFTITVKALELVVDHFLCCSWVALPHEFTSSVEKKKLKKLLLLPKLKTDASTK